MTTARRLCRDRDGRRASRARLTCAPARHTTRDSSRVGRFRYRGPRSACSIADTSTTGLMNDQNSSKKFGKHARYLPVTTFVKRRSRATITTINIIHHQIPPPPSTPTSPSPESLVFADYESSAVRVSVSTAFAVSLLSALYFREKVNKYFQVLWSRARLTSYRTASRVSATPRPASPPST